MRVLELLFGGAAQKLGLDPQYVTQHIASGSLESLDTLDAPRWLHETCPVDSPASCSISGGKDSCCYEATNGLFLQTQFWDYAPATGSNETWTIHGLWSDKCLGGFNQFCNPSWEISDPTQILEDAGEHELLQTMKDNWKNMNGNDESLWLHEFNKHGTCMATVNPDCYRVQSPKHQYVVDFYKAVIGLWQTLPSFEFLTDAGIYPDEDRTHTLEEWKQVLGGHHNNKKVYLGCDRSNSITEIWYFFDLKGSVAAGQFNPVDTISTSTCRDGFKWKPKGSKGTPKRPGSPGSPRGVHLSIEGHPGCLISDGSWYKSGTCAGYRVEENVGGVALKTTKGSCGVVSNRLICGKDVTPSDFTLEDGYLAYGGSTEWSAPREPAKFGRVSVSPGEGELTFKIKVQ